MTIASSSALDMPSRTNERPIGNGSTMEATLPTSATPVFTQVKPELNAPEEVSGLDNQLNTQKKKKKKKAKKSMKANDTPKVSDNVDEDRPPILCISRNKHWRYISSYHGPWLQLPLELLESLLILNLDPATLTISDTRVSAANSSFRDPPQAHRSRGFASVSDHSSPDSPRSMFTSLPPPPPLPTPKPGKATPPPIDPGVFRSVTYIRRLIDEASELSVRASSGLSAAALGSLRGGSSFSRDPWGAAHVLGINGMNDGNGGRQISMSPTRIHKLRVLAVQKLAAAYKADEIASSVMVMQGGSVFDDIADRVLKVDPNDVDAKYVQFFHEKIPSRQLAESTTTQQLDHLIAIQPHRLEFYRTRGIVHCFRDDYALAVKDFTYVLRESRAIRKARSSHHTNGTSGEPHGKGTKKRKGKAGGSKSNGQAPPNGTSAPAIAHSPSIDGPDGEPLLLHPSVLPDAPEPIEPQCVFLRGAAYLQHAVHLIEEAILKLEGVRKTPSVEGSELRLCYIENGKYGGVEIGNPDGPLGSRDGDKLKAYREGLASSVFRDQITGLLKKALRDHEKFLTYFDTLEGSEDGQDRDLAQKAELAYHLCENLRQNGQHALPPLPDIPVMFTTYHPLLVESHFSVLLCQLMLGDFASLIPTFYRTAQLVDGLEGYPVFLPPRSMSQAEFIEVLERLAGGWKNGIQAHSLSEDSDEELTPSIIVSSRSPNGKGIDRSMLSPIATSAASSSSDLTIDTSLSEYSSIATASFTGVNGSSSSQAYHETPATDTPSTTSVDDTLPSPTMLIHLPVRAAAIVADVRSRERDNLVESLDCARMLLGPIAARQRQKKVEKSSLEKATANGKKKPLSINIPLHGPRVEIMLAWIGAVHLFDLDTVA
ncbi:unnamed protein product [Somion occarium]|uniref:Uncharacterized protein n=1 Tax=Somion occarium TaxID=3059160 RepID=A0ABP1CGN0_9APHY